MMTTAIPQIPTLSTITHNFLNDYFAFYPNTARMLGFHTYDGNITNFQKTAIHQWVETVLRYREQLNTIHADSLERLERFDYALLRWRVDVEVWQWTVRKEYECNPLFYTNNLLVDDYIKRDYAPLVERTQSLIRHLHHIPHAMDVAKENLVTSSSLPRILIEEAIDVFNGMILFLNNDVAMAFADETVLAANIRHDLFVARDVAAESLQAFVGYLQHTLLPNATEAFAVGEEVLLAMLRYNELIDLPLDNLLAAGKRDLQHNQTQLMHIAAQFDPQHSVYEVMQSLGKDHPAADQLIAETRALLDALRAFLIERDLVTIPDHLTCQVEPTPPFARWAFAMMDTAGPFEEHATDAFYYITLPEPHWTPEEIEGWLTKFDYATMTDVSIHEAYPGHYIHFMNTTNAPTHLSKMFDTYSHFEGWAHYVEQMMLDEGYGNGDMRLRMAQLGEALVRNCRFICAIQMHTHGMSVAEATHFFQTHAYMDKVTAAQEARRGVYDPGYLNYTLGKLLLLKLRENYREWYGDAFSLKQFHDEYIGYGSPPIPLLRMMLLPNDDGVLL